MPTDRTQPCAEWWRNAVIYQVYPRSFQDSDGDGIGDLPGITHRLPYLAELGVDALWISPFYPSPQVDFGYDITDHTEVDPLFGTLEDFDHLLREAHRLGLKVVLDLVPNHTSVQHPWFGQSRRSRRAPKRDWYIWRDPAPDGGPPNNWQSSTGGSAWTFDATTGQYYLHSFLKAQPDLNWRNTEVVRAVHDVMRFWLSRGVDGFRLDMVDYILKDEQLRDESLDAYGRYDPPHARYHLNQPGVVDLMRQLRRVVEEYPGRVLIGEVEYRLPVERIASYYGRDGDALHLPFNFWLLFLEWSAPRLAEFANSYLAALPAGACPNWVLGNHDVSRPASRLGPAAARAAMVLLHTLRGTSVIYYGDELGVPDQDIPRALALDPWSADLDGGGRDRARTPMRWTGGANAGFAPADAEPWLPVGSDTDTLNVAAESACPDSMLALTRRLLDLRRATPLRHGVQTPLTAQGSTLCFCRQAGNERYFVAVNTADRPQVVTVPDGGAGRICISSSTGRHDGLPVTGRLELGPDEACVVRLDDAAR